MPRPSVFENLPPHILERIAYHAVAVTFLGPPAALLPLLVLSRRVHGALSTSANPHLYAALFRLKFDCAAPLRRFGQRWLTAPRLANELRRRCAALQRFRRRRQYQNSDLWIAYLLLLEGDGRNERQLLGWAQFSGYLDNVISHRICAPLESPFAWLGYNEGTSLTLWLLWMTTTPASIQAQSPQQLRRTVASLHHFIIAGFLYPSVHAANKHFHSPPRSNCLQLHQRIEDADEEEELHSGARATHAVSIVHFSRTLSLAVPIVTTPALLGTLVRLESTSRNLGFLQRLLAFCCHSKQRDADWNRLLTSGDARSPLRQGSVTYVPGTLSGRWEGRLLVPDAESYWHMLNDHDLAPSAVTFTKRSMRVRLREHHCLRSDVPIDAAEGRDEDVTNAWIPPRIECQTAENAILMYDPIAKRQVRYETFHPGTRAHYSEIGIRKLARLIPRTGESQMQAHAMGRGGPYGSSGVLDILITGEGEDVEHDQGSSYRFKGRVRPWDGLIVLVCILNQTGAVRRWLFQGYVHGQNFVGRWRDAVSDVEGGFAFLLLLSPRHEDANYPKGLLIPLPDLFHHRFEGFEMQPWNIAPSAYWLHQLVHLEY